VDLESASSSLSNLAQAGAIVIGGGWAYLKFVRGRTFGSRARLQVAVDRYRRGEDPTLVVHVSMHNEGLSKIDMSLPDEKLVRVDAIAAENWMPDLSIDWDEDATVVRRTPLLQEHEWLEPNETIEDQLLIPVQIPGGSEAIAYRVTARVTQPPQGRRRRRGQTWTAVLVMPVTLVPEDAAPERSVSSA
jgi:hypothetical protein